MKTADMELWNIRAGAMTIVYLTRRKDLKISPSSLYASYDYLVAICRDGKPTTRVFGVGAQAVHPAQRLVTRQKQLSSQLYQESDHSQAIPGCIFLFAMRDDSAYYAWLDEPVVAGEDTKLVANTELTFSDLNNETLASIVRQVDAWYEVVGSRQTALAS